MKRSGFPVILVGVLIALGALFFLFGPGQIIVGLLRIRQMERRLVKPEVYGPVATNLAIFCQSFESLGFTNKYLRSSQLPQPLPTLGAPRGLVTSEGAGIEFGGGFHHFGYHLERVQEASTEQTNVWELFFESEGAAKRSLTRVALSVSNRISQTEYSNERLRELEGRIKSNSQNLRAHEERIALLIETNPKAVHAACKDAIAAMPTHWWPQLTLALYEAGQGRQSEGEEAFRRFVKQGPSYSRWMYLAWYYQTLGKADQAAEAVEQAVQHPIIDLSDDKQNSESRGYSIAVELYKSGEFKTVQRLCDALLPVRENGNYAKAALQSLKDAAERSNAGEKVDFKPSDAMSGFSPFETLEVSKLVPK